jgi:hypothetical protein
MSRKISNLGDFIIFDEKLRPLVLIELTKITPNSSDIHGGSASARIYHLLKNILNGYVKFGFIILKKEWKKWLKNEEEFLKSKNIYIIYLDFNNNWQEKVIDKISSIITTF